MALFNSKRNKKRQPYYGNGDGRAYQGYGYGGYPDGGYAYDGYPNAGYGNSGYTGGYPNGGAPQAGDPYNGPVRQDNPNGYYPNGAPMRGNPVHTGYRGDVPPAQEQPARENADRADTPPDAMAHAGNGPVPNAAAYAGSGPAPDAAAYAGGGPMPNAATHTHAGQAADPRAVEPYTSPYYDDAEYYRGTGRSRHKGRRYEHHRPSVRYRRKRKARYIDRNGREHRSLFIHDRNHVIINRIVLGAILIMLIAVAVQTGLRFVAQAEQNRIQKETPVAIKRAELVREEAVQAAYVEQLDEIDLKDYTNPFLGEWQARKPGSTTRTTYSYESDGQFDYEVDTFASSRNQTGTGGYLLYDGHLITWREDEGVRAYNYEVIDNSTISVAQLVTNAYGEADLDTPYTYTRVDGSDIVPPEEDAFTPSVGAFVGTWSFDYSEAVKVTFTCKADGSLSYTVSGSSDVPAGKTNGCYLVYEDRMVIWLDDLQTILYRFEVDDADTILMTQLKKSAAGTYTDSGTTFLCERDAG